MLNLLASLTALVYKPYGGGTTNDFDMQVFNEHNRMRTNPKSFIPVLQERLTHFKGNVI